MKHQIKSLPHSDVLLGPTAAGVLEKLTQIIIKPFLIKLKNLFVLF